jgi:hypothetical protein
MTGAVRRLLPAAVALLVLAGCAGATDDPGSAPTAEPGPPWPLTGLEAADPAVDVDGPVVVVKVDNVDAALPQAGLDVADIVVEEPVEGGVTRLAVLVHSSPRGTIGPVRSVRSSDVGIVKPVGGVLVASGGAPEALGDIAAAGIETRLDGTPGFSRDPSRAAPHNLLVDLDEAYAALDAPGPDQAYFDFGDLVVDEEVTRPAGDLVLTYSPAHTTRLVLDGSRWSRDLAEADGFVADTVIALTVEQGTAGYLDPSGAPVPINLTEGTGTGWLAHGGRIVDIEWSKESPGQPWAFSVQGEDVAVPPGRTYLALLPVTTGSLDVVEREQSPTPG